MTPEPQGTTEKVELWKRVRDTLYALPSYFKSDLVISGVLATDLHSFNTSLGATIEQQVVTQLNQMRESWDPHKQYTTFVFERQSQRFPDVILHDTAPPGSAEPTMGIELKGWYVLAKEREPSFRYQVTPAVCADFDLLAVFPWTLSNVVAGSPRLFEPYIASAKQAALARNAHWQSMRARDGTSKAIQLSRISKPYPNKSDPISDQPAHDKGGNFGRYARTGLMDVYRDELFSQTLSGIPLDAWQRFLEIFTEASTFEGRGKPQEKLDSLIKRLALNDRKKDKERFAVTVGRLQELLEELLSLFEPD